MSASSGLEASDLGRRDPRSGAWLIQGVSLTVNNGDRIAIVGQTGAGKTVFLRSLALLDPLATGSIHWRGIAIAGDAVPAYRTQVMYLHQRPSLIEGAVEDNLRYPFTFKAHTGRSFDKARVVELLADLGRHESFLEKSYRDLSGGESQLVALLRAIQLNPPILLLDEPTASLDTATVAAVERLIDHWFASAPTEHALVWVSHDMNQAARISTRIARMTSGHLEVE